MSNDHTQPEFFSKAQEGLVESIVKAHIERRVDERVWHELKWIRRGAAGLGVTNVAALITGFVYVFALLPNQIQGQVVGQVVERLEFQDFNNELNQRIGTANAQIALAEESIKRLQETRVSTVAARLQQIEGLFNDHPNADAALQAQLLWKPRVESLETQMHAAQSALKMIVEVQDNLASVSNTTSQTNDRLLTLIRKVDRLTGRFSLSCVNLRELATGAQTGGAAATFGAMSPKSSFVANLDAYISAAKEIREELKALAQQP